MQCDPDKGSEARMFATKVNATAMAGLTRPAPAPTAAANTPPDAADQLRKLAELHTDGILTDDEFAAKKTDLLGRL